MNRCWSSFSVPVVMLACAPPALPPHWGDGGAPLVIAPARWERGDGEVILIDAKGRVTEDGALRFALDRAGRIVDVDGEPVGVVFPSGEIVGTSNRYLGKVGVANAAPPHSDLAWVAVLPDGKVLRFREDGEREPAGRFLGCEGGMHRTCTLVAHLVSLQDSPPPAARVGVGLGVMYPY
ncbi:MAG: hypothetical protein QM784_34295 [Polyangiaceae bacterium]